METTFVGICSIDLYSQIHALPGNGETIHGIGLNRGFGGKAPNACAQFAFLSDETNRPNLLTVVGNDSDGKVIEEHFKEIGVSTELLQHTDKYPSGLAICFVLDGGESAIVIHPCPVTLEMVEANKERLQKSKIIITNFEVPEDVATRVLEIGREAGVKTILNVSPIPKDPNVSLLKDADIVILNEIEMQRFGKIDDLFAAGVECVINTQGAQGANVSIKGQPVVHVDAPKVKVVDTTGAGDSFLGTFAYCLSKGLDYVAAARVACVCASISVTGIGTQGSYAHRNHEMLKDILPK
jgi:ribokinase